MAVPWWDSDRGFKAYTVLFAAVLGTVAVVFFVVGTRSLLEGAELLANGREIKGVVIDQRTEKVWGPAGEKNQTRARVRYESEDGATHRFWEPSDSGMGDTVTVYYDPRDPGGGTLRHPIVDLLMGLFGVVVGAAVILVALFALRDSRAPGERRFGSRRRRHS